MKGINLVLLVLIFCPFCWALDNGLALTPPMGYMTWLAFECKRNCNEGLDNCLSENLMKIQADRLIETGLRDVGYYNVVVDDCWMATKRDGITDNIIANTERFPNGIQTLGQYMKRNNLKLGMRYKYGKDTDDELGVNEHMELDAKTVVKYGVEYIKLGVRLDDTALKGSIKFGKVLNKTEKSIFFSCCWPVQNSDGDYGLVKETCNSFREAYDFDGTYTQLIEIFDHYKNKQDIYTATFGPGSWFDPDQLGIGYPGFTLDQSKLQMAVYAVMAAPLFISTDLRKIQPEFLDILLNKDVIAVNQDSMGRLGKCIQQEEDFDVWVREVQPQADGGPPSLAVAVHGKFTENGQKEFTITSEVIGANADVVYSVSDLYDAEQEIPDLKQGDSIPVNVNAMGVVFLKFSPK